MARHNGTAPESVSDRHKRRNEMEVIKSVFKLPFLPDWELNCEIGRGGFGCVFREGSPKGNGQLWAVKRIVKREPRIEPEKDSIVREIATSAMLTQQQSESFVEFFGWNEDKLDIYFAMEYIQLGDLEKNLTPVWAEDDTKVATQQLLRGLAVMHSHDITHRDLKPKNIFLLSRDPVHVKIGDFGISKRVPEGSSTNLNTQYLVQGYTAPEMTLEDQYTSAVGLWSLGCVIYRMIGGKRLFERDWDTIRRDEDNIIQQLEALMPENLSRDGVDIMAKLLLKDPKRRLTAEAALKHTWVESRLDGVSL